MTDGARSVDLLKAELLPELPAAFVDGRDLDLLRPLEFVASAASPAAFDKSPAKVDRRALAEGLAVANAAYGHADAEGLAERLADPETAVVVTGQQTGLFGGPLYTLTKAVAATLWAERLTAAGRPAVSVFWMATEDHDYREVAAASFPAASADSGLLTLDLGDDPSPLMPVGMRSLGPTIDRRLDDLRAAMPGDRFAAWVDRLAAWYRPNARFGEAFARLMAELLGAHCPLLLDAMLPAVKEAESPWLERVVADQDAIAALQAARDRAIQEAGYQLQVQPQPGTSPLFYLHGMERRRIAYDGDRVLLRGADDVSEPMSWLEEAVRDNPAVVSPGVLARPAIQDAILGTYLQVLGPGEVAYMPQVAPLYAHLGLEAPYVALRPQALILGRHQLDKLDDSGLELAEYLAPDLDLDRALGGHQSDELVAGAVADIGRRLDELRAEALAVDAGLAGPFDKTRKNVEGALSSFAAKAAKALARRDQISRQRAEALRVACRPGGKLQERVVSSAYFPGKYGDRFVEALFEQLDLDGRRLSLIDPSPPQRKDKEQS